MNRRPQDTTEGVPMGVITGWSVEGPLAQPPQRKQQLNLSRRMSRSSSSEEVRRRALRAEGAVDPRE